MTYFTPPTVVVSISILSLLDLSAYFDTTDHKILFTGSRLRATFGCFSTVLHWLILLFKIRTQSVFVGHESAWSVLKCEVPQGSVLGPLLFTLYRNPLRSKQKILSMYTWQFPTIQTIYELCLLNKQTKKKQKKTKQTINLTLMSI